MQIPEKSNRARDMGNDIWSTFFVFLVVGSISLCAVRQTRAVPYGRVTDDDRAAVPNANVRVVAADRSISDPFDAIYT